VEYKFLKASPDFGKSQKDIYTQLFQETLNQQFSNSSDIWTIQEETSFSAGIYQDVDVRIVTHVINSATGRYLGDDYKQILFQDLEHAVGIGYMYQFNDNYWITINSEKTKNLAASSTVKRCNNVLRWIDLQGAVHAVPCSIDYIITRNKDLESTNSFVVYPEGTIQVVCQFNDETNLIVANQRFLFGNQNNWTAYRVEGGGVNNYNNVETIDNTTVGFITLTMKIDFLSDNDDKTNGIAYDKKQVYTLTLSEATIAGIPTNIRQLYATVNENDLTVSRTVVWSSSDTAKATVSATGLVTLIANGSAVITCALDGDATVKDTATVTISATPSDYYQIIISPDTNYVLEGDTETYSVYLYKNGTIQADTFTITLNAGTVPTENFAFSYTAIPGNDFTIENKEKFLSDSLIVTCVSGTHSATFEVSLRGSW
jgi:hypothetical protein